MLWKTNLTFKLKHSELFNVEYVICIPVSLSVCSLSTQVTYIQLNRKEILQFIEQNYYMLQTYKYSIRN